MAILVSKKESKIMENTAIVFISVVEQSRQEPIRE